MKRSVTVQVAGQRFTIKTEDDDRQVRALAAHVDERFRELQRSARTPDTQTIALMTALQIAEDLFEARREATDLKRRIREKARGLLDYLAKVARV